MAVERDPYPPLLPEREQVSRDTHDNLPLAKVKAGLEEAGSPLVEVRLG